MKTLCMLVGITVLLCGCSSTQSVAKLQGKGMKHTFAAPYDATWKAALDSARRGDLRVQNYDLQAGTIQSRTATRMESWGEVVGIWVTSLNSSNTQVEVVSRTVGPTGLFYFNWEKQVLKDIAADLALPMPQFPPPPIARSPKG